MKSILGNRLAAVAERGDHPKIHIFDLKSFRKNLTLVNSSASQSKVTDCIFAVDEQSTLLSKFEFENVILFLL